MSTSEVGDLRERIKAVETQLELLNKHLDGWKNRDYWVRLALTLLAGAGLALGAGSVVRDGFRDVGAAVSEMK